MVLVDSLVPKGHPLSLTPPFLLTAAHTWQPTPFRWHLFRHKFRFCFKKTSPWRWHQWAVLMRREMFVKMGICKKWMKMLNVKNCRNASSKRGGIFMGLLAIRFKMDSANSYCGALSPPFPLFKQLALTNDQSTFPSLLMTHLSCHWQGGR